MSSRLGALDASYYEEDTEFSDQDAQIGEDDIVHESSWTRQDEGDRDNNLDDDDGDQDDDDDAIDDYVDDVSHTEQQQDVAVTSDQIKASFFTELRKLEAEGLTDIGNLASWAVSSTKAGCEKEHLLKDDPETFWQSDGVQPHTITIHFSKRVSIQSIALFADYILDESYTPSEILVRAGTGEHDLQDVTTVILKDPQGWSLIEFEQVLKAFLLKIVIKSNHQNGKDTHIRSLKIFQKSLRKEEMDHGDIFGTGFEFKTVKMLSGSCIR